MYIVSEVLSNYFEARSLDLIAPSFYLMVLSHH